MFPTFDVELRPLRQLLNWAALREDVPALVLMDPCAGVGKLTRYFERHQQDMLGDHALYKENDIDPSRPIDYPYDVVVPNNFQALPPADCIVSSHPFELQDAILPGP